jgi:hypothetical protein
MVKLPIEKANHRAMKAIDDLMGTDLFGNTIVETLDPSVLKLLDEIEMNETMERVETLDQYGILSENGNEFVADLTEEGSSAVSRISFVNDYLYVTFRKSETVYEYSISDDTREEIYETILNRLSGGKDSSVGSMIQQMIHNGKMVLI